MECTRSPRPRMLAVIPARGGSRRLPRKNVLPMAGRPMLEWTALAALDVSRLDRVVLTTDDEEIAGIGRRAGVDVPRLRPAALATDDADSYGVLRDAIDMVGGPSRYDYLVELQPTSPLRTAADINACIDLVEAHPELDCVYTVAPTDHPITWCNTLPDDHSMRDFFDRDTRTVRSQDMATTYRLTGAVQIFRISRLVAQGNFDFDDSTMACITPRERAFDIDDQLDFDLAEFLLTRDLASGQRRHRITSNASAASNPAAAPRERANAST